MSIQYTFWGPSNLTRAVLRALNTICEDNGCTPIVKAFPYMDNSSTINQQPHFPLQNATTPNSSSPYDFLKDVEEEMPSDDSSIRTSPLICGTPLLNSIANSNRPPSRANKEPFTPSSEEYNPMFQNSLVSPNPDNSEEDYDEMRTTLQSDTTSNDDDEMETTPQSDTILYDDDNDIALPNKAPSNTNGIQKQKRMSDHLRGNEKRINKVKAMNTESLEIFLSEKDANFPAFELAKKANSLPSIGAIQQIAPPAALLPQSSTTASAPPTELPAWAKNIVTKTAEQLKCKMENMDWLQFTNAWKNMNKILWSTKLDNISIDSIRKISTKHHFDNMLSTTTQNKYKTEALLAETAYNLYRAKELMISNGNNRKDKKVLRYKKLVILGSMIHQVKTTVEDIPENAIVYFPNIKGKAQSWLSAYFDMKYSKPLKRNQWVGLAKYNMFEHMIAEKLYTCSQD